MAGSSITSSLTIKLIDDVSGPAKTVAKALKLAEQQAKEIGKALEQAGVSSRLGEQLRRLGASAGDIRAVGDAWKRYAAEAKLAAQASDWTKGQASSVLAWERQTVGALKNVQREEQAFARAQQRMRDAQQRMRDRAGLFGRIIGPPWLAAGAGEVAMGMGLPAVGATIATGIVVKDAVEAGSKLQTQQIRMQTAGMTPTEISAADLQAIGLTKKYPTVSRAEIEKIYRETRASLVHPEETKELLDTVVATKAAMDAAGATGSENMAYVVKAAEIQGITKDKERFKRFMDTFAKAQQVAGATLKPEDLLEFAKMSRLSGVMLSDRFRGVVLSLSQEMGGAMSGTGMNQFVKQITGSFRGPQASALKDWLALGLVDKKDIDYGKGGKILGLKPFRHPKDYMQAATDPDKYMYEHVVPAMQNLKMSDADQILFMQKLFPAGRASDIAQKLLTQRENFEQHSRNYAAAMGLDSVEVSLKGAAVAADALKTSFENLSASITRPTMDPAASMMTAAASVLNTAAAAFSQFGLIGSQLKGIETIGDWLGKEITSIRDLYGRKEAPPPEAATLPPAPSWTTAPITPITPQVDTSSVTGAGQAAEDAKTKIDGLNVTVSPQVDTGPIAAALRMVEALEASLRRVGSLVGSVGSGISADTVAASRLKAAMGNTQRGRFATGGVQGE